MKSSEHNPAKSISAIVPALETKKTFGNFNGSTLVIDEETGFLTNAGERVRALPGTSGFGPLSVFAVGKKLEFLNRLRECWPNYSLAASQVGISRLTFKNHYEIDEAFRECVDEIKERMIDAIEKKRMEMAMLDKGTLDRMAVMNAYRREIYDRGIHVEIETKMSGDDVAKRSGRLGQVIDAQIVEKVKDQDKVLRKAHD